MPFDGIDLRGFCVVLLRSPEIGKGYFISPSITF